MAGESGQGGVSGEGVAVDVAGALEAFTPAEPPAEGVGGGETPPGEQPPALKEGEQPPEGDKPTPQEAEIADLKGQLARLTELVSTIQKPAEPPPKVEVPQAVKYFEKPEDFEAAFEKQENFEALLEKHSIATADRATRNLLKQLPTVVSNLVTTHVGLSRGIDKFYTENKDLADKKQFVGHVANDLMGKNPGWNLNKLFGELGKEVRTRLGVKPAPGKGGPGGLPRRTGSRLPVGKEPPMEGLQGEIVDLLEDQGGIKR